MRIRYRVGLRSLWSAYGQQKAGTLPLHRLWKSAAATTHWLPARLALEHVRLPRGARAGRAAHHRHQFAKIGVAELAALLYDVIYPVCRGGGGRASTK